MRMREGKYCLTPVKLSLKEDERREGRFLSFPSPPLLILSPLLPVSPRLVSSCPTCQSGGWSALHRRQLVCVSSPPAGSVLVSVQ